MEKNAPKFTFNKKLAAIGGAALVLAASALLLLRPGNIVSELKVEAGRESISANEFRKEDKGIDAQFVSDMTGVDLKTPGQYPVKVEYKNKTHDCTVVVEDTIAPQGTIHNVSVYSNQTLVPEDFVSGIIDATDVTVTWKPEPDLTVEAQTLMTITLTDAAGNATDYEAVLSVFVDNGEPQLSGVAPLFTYIGTEPDYLENVTAMDDRDMALEIQVDKSKVDLNAVGTYDIVYSVTDAAGNTTSVPTTLTVTDDNVAPTIQGVHNISLYLGSGVSYRSGIVVTDDKDPNPKLDIDSSKVDLSNIGTYPLVYTAKDMTGNTTRIEVTVSVAEKPATYVEEEVINAKADELLKKIVTENMEDDAKVKAIYAYVRSHYTYSGHSDKTDWLQGAYVMMTEGQGDCFNYYAVTKLLLDRCGIPNIDVRKVRNFPEDSDHYWSLVSVDGGKTYYHLDTTPRVGDGDDFCLVTDKLKADAKVRAIYAYVRSHYTYSGHSDKTDWLQGAYVMMTEGQGDCFNYYAVTKLLLDRCGIPNIDVRKVRNFPEDSDHYWSLVSVDGGKTYYHLDTTPRVGDGDDFCLVTDKFLDDYSAKNKNCHNRDKSLYPATPEA